MKTPLLIYQMGKVGSSSVLKSLKRSKQFDLYHIHYFGEKKHRRIGYDVEHVKTALKVLELGLLERDIKIITMVREPLARNLSAFFQNYRKRITLGMDSKDQIEIFMTKYPHHLPKKWFDTEMKEFAGIDVFAHPFDKERGWSRIQQDNVDLLIMRLESSDQEKQNALTEFLGAENFKYVRSNVGSEKKYAEDYGNVLQEITFPDNYARKLYGTEYSKHFYTPEEIQTFYEYWTTEAGREQRRAKYSRTSADDAKGR